MKRTAISRTPSRRKRAFDAEYAKVLPEVLARGCEFLAYWNKPWGREVGPPLTQCSGRLVGHHAKGRKVADANAPENLRCLCEHHHIDVVHRNGRWAREVGLMVSRIS